MGEVEVDMAENTAMVAETTARIAIMTAAHELRAHATLVSLVLVGKSIRDLVVHHLIVIDLP